MAKKYAVTVPLFASYHVVVKAESESDAVQKAYDCVPSSLCHQCANEIDLNGIDENADPNVEELE